MRDLFHKSFLFVVGVITIGFDEFSQAIEEAAKSIEEQREKMAKNMPKIQA